MTTLFTYFIVARLNRYLLGYISTTGSIGTTIFYVVGAVLVLGDAAFSSPAARLNRNNHSTVLAK